MLHVHVDIMQGLRAKKVTWIPIVILIIIVMFVVNCIDRALRLVGRSTDREGRVEVCVGGRWGTVQTNQSLEVARTVCRNQSQIMSFYSTSPCYG